MSAPTGVLQRGRFWLQDRIAQHPMLLRMNFSLRHRRARILADSGADLLIEAFPRSGNTFAAWSFKLANPEARLAHHVHTRAHVLLALRYRVPALILLRSPVDAVQSLLVRRPEIPPELALRRYCAFSDGLDQFADRLVFAQFETVTSDFGRVINAVNQRFGTAFNGNIRASAVFEAIERDNRAGHGGQIDARTVPRPHAERDRLKRRISLADYRVALDQAERCYQRLKRLAV